MSPADIAIKLGRGEEDVQNGLSRMKKAGRVEHLEHGLWQLPIKGKVFNQRDEEKNQVIEPVSKINIAGMQHGEVLVRYVPTKDEATGEPFYARITIERLTPDEAKRELGK